MSSRRTLPLLAALGVVGCQVRAAEHASDARAIREEFACAPDARADRPREAAPVDESAPPWSTTLSEAPTPEPSRFETVRIGAETRPPSAPRPRSRGRIDVEVVNASFEDVARFLSDAGGFNVVVDAPTTPVTARLRGVDAFEALLALAEVRGLSVEYRAGIARVSAR